MRLPYTLGFLWVSFRCVIPDAIDQIVQESMHTWNIFTLLQPHSGTAAREDLGICVIASCRFLAKEDKEVGI